MHIYGLAVCFLNLTQCSQKWNTPAVCLNMSWGIQMWMFQFTRIIVRHHVSNANLENANSLVRNWIWTNSDYQNLIPISINLIKSNIQCIFRIVTNAKLNYHTFNSFCSWHRIYYDLNSRNSIRAKSIFAYYIFYYIKNNLFQNIKMLFVL